MSLGGYVTRLHHLLAVALPLWGLRGDTGRSSIDQGRRLAHQYCVTCHVYPEPSTADLATWHNEILPRMKYRLGFSTPELDRSTNIAILRQHHRIPLTPIISEAEWAAISAFYFAEAPKEPLASPAREPIPVGGLPFRVVVPELRLTNQSVSAVTIDSSSKVALIGDDARRTIYRIDAAGRLLDSTPLGQTPSRIRVRGSGLDIAGMGFLPPNDLQAGELLRVADRQTGPPGRVLDRLRRPVDFVEYPSPTLSFVVAEFGNNVGGITWHRRRASGDWSVTELFGLPGAVKLERLDYDRDGRDDVVGLVAQETEALFLWRSGPSGDFERRTLFQRPPSYGHSHFECADFDADGRADFLVCNGDNGEFNSRLKRYHGVRIFLSNTNGGVDERWFYPLNGAYGATARDFDGDGDLDIAAISYFPDYERNPRESFVYFENTGGFRFKPSTIKECIAGRWMTMASGDVDGDGDDDLMLGSYILGPTRVPEFLMQTWKSSRIPALLLINQSQRRAASTVGP
jgi:hypothetical protein